jgi:hypothetical protein
MDGLPFLPYYLIRALALLDFGRLYHGISKYRVRIKKLSRVAIRWSVRLNVVKSLKSRTPISHIAVYLIVCILNLNITLHSL